jgi:hypothetical protein
MEYIIIGTDHDRQRSDFSDTGLRDKLQEYSRTQNVVLIAEEVDANKDVQTFGRDLVGCTKWLSIDMTTEERKSAGIYRELSTSPPGCDDNGQFYLANWYHKRADAIRENFWLDRIERWCKQNGVRRGVIIITCGHNHRPYLADKIKQRDPASNVLIDEYMPYDKEKAHGRFTECDCSALGPDVCPDDHYRTEEYRN